ncbi:hypothetical protein KI387_029840, partial [Taxus chinensis]
MVFHSGAQTSSGKEFATWLASQTLPNAKEVIDLEEMDLQLLKSIVKKGIRSKAAKVTSRMIIGSFGQKNVEVSTLRQ